jgi:hypothetical protein
MKDRVPEISTFLLADISARCFFSTGFFRHSGRGGRLARSTCVKGFDSAFIKGVGRLKEGLLIILALEKLFSQCQLEAMEQAAWAVGSSRTRQSANDGLYVLKGGGCFVSSVLMHERNPAILSRLRHHEKI